MPIGDEHDAVASETERCKAEVFRGSEHDVLSRYAGAACALNADIVMRVTSDCPAIDPAVCSEVLSMLKREEADYACNNRPRTFPHGLDCEAFVIDALNLACREAIEPEEREHVTLWLRNNEELKRVNLECEDTTWTDQRWTLDNIEDYEFFKALFHRLPEDVIEWRRIIQIVNSDPEISRLQKACRLQEAN